MAGQGNLFAGGMTSLMASLLTQRALGEMIRSDASNWPAIFPDAVAYVRNADRVLYLPVLERREQLRPERKLNA